MSLQNVSIAPRIARVVTILIITMWSGNLLALEWPQEIVGDKATITIYQPQPESLIGNQLKARAAMSFQMKDASEPIFGAIWFTANVDTDADSGTAIVRDLVVSDVRWPDSKDAGQQQFSAAVEKAAEGHQFEISMDELSASLATADSQQKSLENIKNDAPKIIFERQLGVLVLYDGKPNFSAVENSNYERALNTPVLVVRNTRSKTCYLSSGTLWYQAEDPLGPWSPTTNPPADLVKMLPAADDAAAAPAKTPVIVTATEPTELISSDGEPKWTSLTGGKILYVQNTETPWLRELSTGNMYILLSGRWFRSKNESGPWTFVRADELPDSFKNIPPDSDIGGLRASVAGTEEAQDAIYDAQIPQTAAIKRSDANLTVEYDGSPKFEAISGTKVSYAVNTAAQVLLVEGQYYAVDNGVWFSSKSANGPWLVADSVPKAEIDKIPPSSPVYNTTYVTIYESTPEVVYVGYTPGYMWSYPYYGVPIYGTGWYYPPYYGRYYYPRPPTWGLHVGYNPWTGWNAGVSWSNGFFTMGVSFGGGYGGGYYPGRCCGSYHGGGYHGGNTIINTGDINIGNNVSVGNRNQIGNRAFSDNNVRGGERNNIYNRPENSKRNADPKTARRDLKQARTAPDKANNVYADKNGNVARNNNGKWETRDQGSWKSQPNNAAQRPTTSPDTSQRNNTKRSVPSSFDRGGMDRAHQSRQHGASRAAARPAGGGGRRR
ncbi:MAG: carbohydrate-binding family V/XII [Woeseiaceae bacterium]|nr:carbohydrate-binding family V/XII [Woeseiaceae bacterium]